MSSKRNVVLLMTHADRDFGGFAGNQETGVVSGITFTVAGSSGSAG